MLRNRLHDLKIDSEANAQAAQEAGGEGSQFKDEDILEMQETITQQGIDYNQLQEKFKKVNIVND